VQLYRREKVIFCNCSWHNTFRPGGGRVGKSRNREQHFAKLLGRNFQLESRKSSPSYQKISLVRVARDVTNNIQYVNSAGVPWPLFLHTKRGRGENGTRPVETILLTE
jgi:hypothetical protein